MVFYNSLMEPTEFTAAAARTARRFSMDLSRSLVMVSGGPDSVALLRALVELEMRPVVLHVDHGLRGEESLTDANSCGTVRGILAWLRERRHARRGNLQSMPGRTVPLAGVVVDDSLSPSPPAHRDDVAETVLLNLRGGGAAGGRGIPRTGRICALITTAPRRPAY